MSESKTESRTFGLVAVLLGAVAFAAVVGHFFVGPIDPPPPLEVSIAEKAASIRDATVAALKGEEYTAKSNVRQRTLDDYMTYTFIGLAVLAILMAIVAFIRDEPWRPIVAGAGLGGLASASQFTIVVFFALLFAFLLAAVLDKLDFSF